MNGLFLKKIGKIAIEAGKVIIIEGVISLASQKLRETSRTNYNTVKDDLRQGINLTKNQLTGAAPEDWDII